MTRPRKPRVEKVSYLARYTSNNPDLLRAWQEFNRMELSTKTRLVYSALKTIKSIAELHRNEGLDNLCERFHKAAKYLALLNANRCHYPPLHSQPAVEHMWRVATALEKGLTELATAISKYAKCLELKLEDGISESSGTASDLFDPDAISSVDGPPNERIQKPWEIRFALFENSLSALERSVTESKIQIELIVGRERGTTQTANKGKQKREHPDSSLNKVHKAKRRFEREGHPDREHVGRIARETGFSPQHVRRLLKLLVQQRSSEVI